MKVGPHNKSELKLGQKYDLKEHAKRDYKTRKSIKTKE